MTTSSLLRGCFLGAATLLLTSCDDGLEIRFSQPFPAQLADLVAFPARHRAVYTASDSSKSLCIGRTAVWRQELQQVTLSRHQADSMAHHRLRADTTYEQDGHLHYVRLMGRDSVRDSWLWTDTVFTLMGTEPGRLRRFQGRYYLNTPDETGGKWTVQRLDIDGPRLSWQALGTDTLRLLALDPGTIHFQRENGRLTSIQLTPASGAQTRRVGRYAGLWVTKEEYRRRH